jgi:hypothetical protein
MQRERAPSALLGLAPNTARLERQAEHSGSELLRGETRFDLLQSGIVALVTEEAELDAQGRLAWARVHVAWRRLSAPEGSAAFSIERTSFDALEGLRISRTDSDATHTRRIATDLPWSYLPIATPEGVPLSTPIAAIVARRAAEVSTAVRRIDPFGQDVTLTSDQILIADDHEDLVVIGDDLAIFSRNHSGPGDLVRLHLAALDLDLTPRQMASEF